MSGVFAFAFLVFFLVPLVGAAIAAIIILTRKNTLQPGTRKLVLGVGLGVPLVIVLLVALAALGSFSARRDSARMRAKRAEQDAQPQAMQTEQLTGGTSRRRRLRDFRNEQESAAKPLYAEIEMKDGTVQRGRFLRFYSSQYSLLQDGGSMSWIGARSVQEVRFIDEEAGAKGSRK